MPEMDFGNESDEFHSARKLIKGIAITIIAETNNIENYENEEALFL